MYKCPCCKNYTLSEEPPGTFEICEICNWQDDNVQCNDLKFEGGANEFCLNEAREIWKNKNKNKKILKRKKENNFTIIIQKHIPFQNITDIAQWAGLKTIEEYNAFLLNICNKKEEFKQYKYLFEDIQKTINDEKLKNTLLPENLVNTILDDLGMVVFKRKDSNTLSSLSYEFGKNTIRLANEWALYIRVNGWDNILEYTYKDETIIKTSQALEMYGFQNIQRLYERTNISLDEIN